MEQAIEDFIIKVIEIGANIKEGESLVVYMPEEIPEIENIILELKDEYKIGDIVFIKQNYEKLYNFLITNPTDEEIEKYIETYPIVKQSCNIKQIYFNPLTEHCPYYTKLIQEIRARYIRYREIDAFKNKLLYEQIPGNDCVLTICPSKAWSKELFGDESKINELWNLLINTIPSIEELKKITNEQQEIARYLNGLKINSLNFYTDKGTDFHIKLARASKWITNPIETLSGSIFTNFPSYEIYTAPNYLSAEGKVVLTKPSFLYGGTRIDEAEIIFSKGKVISCESNNDAWNNIIYYKPNNLYRIGEVALVPANNPIFELNQTFNQTILDENTGCHIALGNSYKECINITEQLLETKGKKYYRFNESKYHQDLTIGDESICVEANIRGKVKTLIKDGKWTL